MNHILLWITKTLNRVMYRLGLHNRFRAWLLGQRWSLQKKILMDKRRKHWESLAGRLDLISMHSRDCTDCKRPLTTMPPVREQGCCLPYPPVWALRETCHACYHGTSKPATLTTEVV